MNKTLLILRHEFGHTVRRRGFIVMTLIVPLIALLLIGVFQLISGIAGPTVEAMTIGYVDELGGFQQYTSQGNITLVRFDTSDDATEALVNGDIKEYFVIPQDYISTGVINRYTLERQLAASPAITAAINNFLLNNLLAGKVPWLRSKAGTGTLSFHLFLAFCWRSLLLSPPLICCRGWVKRRRIAL